MKVRWAKSYFKKLSLTAYSKCTENSFHRVKAYHYYPVLDYEHSFNKTFCLRLSNLNFSFQILIALFNSIFLLQSSKNLALSTASLLCKYSVCLIV